jgi:hypothetical protein
LRSELRRKGVKRVNGQVEVSGGKRQQTAAIPALVIPAERPHPSRPHKWGREGWGRGRAGIQ